MAGKCEKDPTLKREIISFVDDYFVEYHRQPSLRQIAEGVGCGKTTVARYISALCDEGKLEYDGKSIVTDLIRNAGVPMQLAPVVGRIACGQPNFAEEDFEELVPLPKALFGEGEFFILRAHGDSMIEAGIDEGDMIVLRKQNHARENEIVAFLTDEGEATLKRIHYDNEHRRIILHPENSSMKDIIINRSEDCIILGVACHVIKKL